MIVQIHFDMRKSLALLFLGCAMWLNSAPGANLLVNGGFEDPALTTNWNFTGAYSFSGWAGNSTGSGGGGGDAGIAVGVDFGLAPADGNQAFSFNGDNPPAGTYLEQTFSTVSGHLYFLTFDVGRNNGFSSQSLRLQVQLFDSANAQIGFGTFNAPLSVTYAPEQIGFIANSSLTRLRFTDISGSNPNTDLLLDKVAVTEAPEPCMGGLLLGGAVAGLFRWRRLIR